ncbi:hypothetical protein HGRIS_008360 [Hohenbuehelia grisea]|uniref:FAD-binding domain-containing protein n=1 Tax=Hohenbuehelia grisea TaxID=104357 RepID=A0ABR3J835_9AGAR
MTSTMPTKDFKVAIVGGGMCGLLCAYGLGRRGIQVDVFESAPQFGEVGAGVGLGPNAVRALTRMGVFEAVLKQSESPSAIFRAFRFVSGMNPHEIIYDYPALDTDKGLGIHRAAFLDAILNIIDRKVAHLNKRFVSVEESTSKRLILHFSDGTTHEADIIVGADGIKSTVRDFVTEEGEKPLKFSRTFAYRGLIPTDVARRAGVQSDLTLRPHCFVGKYKHIITFPIHLGRTINVVAFSTDHQTTFPDELPHPWVQAVTNEELMNDFQGWGSDVVSLLSCMHTPSRWSIHGLSPLSSYVRGKVVLIGDSAHAMLPHLGAGVGQGFEDTLLLCELLGHPETELSNIAEVLRTYSDIRAPRATMVLQGSANAGKVYESYAPDGYSFEEMQEKLDSIWHPVWHHNLDDDLNAAVISLQKRGVFAQPSIS